MGYHRNDCWMTCGEMEDACAKYGIDPFLGSPWGEIERLRVQVEWLRTELIRARDTMAGLKVSSTGKVARMAAVERIHRALASAQK